MIDPFDQVLKEFQRRYRGDKWNGFIAQEPPLNATDKLKTLCEQKGRVMGVVTGRPHDEAAWTMEKFGWKPYLPLLIAREKHEGRPKPDPFRSEEHTSELQSRGHLVCRLLLEKKNEPKLHH